MAIGPIQFAAAVGFRSVAPMAYANPFNGGLISWVADPSNDWDVIAYVLIAVIACSAAWLVNGTITFFETRLKTAAVTLVVVVMLLVALVQGDKFNPFDWRQVTTAGLFVLAYLSACGRVFAYTEDQKDKD